MAVEELADLSHPPGTSKFLRSKGAQWQVMGVASNEYTSTVSDKHEQAGFLVRVVQWSPMEPNGAQWSPVEAVYVWAGGKHL